MSRTSQAAAHTLGLDLHVLNATTERDFDAVFANLLQLRAGGLVIGSGAFFNTRSEQLAALTVRHAVPAVSFLRRFVAAGGLASYGGDVADTYRLAGVFTGRILKGEKPGELPVQQSTKVEMFLNLRTTAMKPANKARKAHCGGVCGGGRRGSEPGSRVTGAGVYTATCAVTHPRREPYAGKPHVRIWAGGVR